MTALDLDYDLLAHLADPDSVLLIQAEGLSADLIEDPDVERAFQWQQKHCRKHGKPAKRQALQDEFPKLQIGEPQTAVEDLLDRLRKRYIANRGRNAIRDLSAIATTDPLNVADAMIKKGKRLSQLTVSRKGFGRDDVARAMSLYDKHNLSGPGPSLGWKEVDEHFYGQRGVTFLAGMPKSYKSWIAIAAMTEQARRGEFPFFYTLELPDVDAQFRVLCHAANLPYWKYLQGSFTNEERKQLLQASDHLGDFRVEQPEPGRRTASMIVERALNSGATCVFIDQLQYLEGTNGRSLGATNETGAYFEVCDELRNYSDQIPIFVVHQFNRTVMGATELPAFQQLKGSAAIEEVASLVLGLYSNKDMRKSNLLELGTMISRHYDHASWEIKLNLSTGCSFKLLGPSPDLDATL